MKVIIDTNVLVSGLLSPQNYCGRVIDLLIAGEIKIIYDSRIISEYTEVLSRKKFKIKNEELNILIKFIELNGEIIVPLPRLINMKDISDLPFVECALHDKENVLVTGNKKHFQNIKGLNIFLPKEFIVFISS
jgi:putative PIN family toxin of toxin-antitoxin system